MPHVTIDKILVLGTAVATVHLPTGDTYDDIRMSAALQDSYDFQRSRASLTLVPPVASSEELKQRNRVIGT